MSPALCDGRRNCDGKEVIATQAITFLFLTQFLCLSPR